MAGVAALIGVNAMDVELSAEARALLEPPVARASDERNGYLHFLGLHAPAGASTYAHGLRVLEALRASEAPTPAETGEAKALTEFPRIVGAQATCCRVESGTCLGAPAEATRDTLGKYGPFLERARQMRDAPDYLELYAPAAFHARVAPYHALLDAQCLTHAAIALAAGSAGLGRALDELEAEMAFHRRALAGSRTRVGKIFAAELLARDALLLSELLRAGRETAAAERERIARLLEPLSAEEADMRAALASEYRLGLRLVMTLGKEQTLAHHFPVSRWYEGVLFLRRHETANAIAAQFRLDEALSRVPLAGFEAAARERARQQPPAYAEGEFPGWVNPAGKILAGAAGAGNADSLRRMNDVRALLAMVAAQAALYSAGARTPEAVRAALAGGVGRAHPDPYTEKPFAYDEAANALTFAPQAKEARWQTRLRERFAGRVGVTL
ncbi:MAG: hypothetical protein N2653_12630 [Burkholderiales bacterium]|nr:hypothetical protein [Burkholderiales bacterium]